MVPYKRLEVDVSKRDTKDDKAAAEREGKRRKKNLANVTYVRYGEKDHKARACTKPSCDLPETWDEYQIKLATLQSNFAEKTARKFIAIKKKLFIFPLIFLCGRRCCCILCHHQLLDAILFGSLAPPPTPAAVLMRRSVALRDI